MRRLFLANSFCKKRDSVLKWECGMYMYQIAIYQSYLLDWKEKRGNSMQETPIE